MSDVLVDGDLTLRRAVPADAADIREVYNEPDIQLWMLWEPEEYDEAEALANIERSEEAWAGFLDWTLEQLHERVAGSTTSVVTAYGVDVGRLRVVRTEALVELAGLQLLPAHQGKGIGTRIIRDLMAEAVSSGRTFGLSVEKDNPRAQALYERLGLVVVGDDGDEYVMRRP